MGPFFLFGTFPRPRLGGIPPLMESLIGISANKPSAAGPHSCWTLTVNIAASGRDRKVFFPLNVKDSQSAGSGNQEIE